MKNVAEELSYYALGLKGHVHKIKNGKLKENKSVTKVQDFLGNHFKPNVKSLTRKRFN